MHGAGNDYIYVDQSVCHIGNPSEAAVCWSDRHKGIGSDGLVLIDRSPVPEADFSMRIFNADGSEAMMCGNASRCIGKYLYERKLTDKTEIRLLTLSGVKTLWLNVVEGRVGSVAVDMLEILTMSFSPTMWIGWTRWVGCLSTMPHSRNGVISNWSRCSTMPPCAPGYGKGVVASRWLVARVRVPQPWRQPSRTAQAESQQS